MKRLVIGLLLAATAYAPFAATAQRREQIGPVTDDVDRIEQRQQQEQRRAARQERRAARIEAGGTVQTPAADRPRRDRNGDGQPARRDRAEVARPDPIIDRAPRPDRIDRPDRGGQRPIRPQDSADFADYETDPRNARAERREDRRDLRRDRRDRLGVDSRFRSEPELDRGDRFDGRRFDGRSADLYRGGQVWNRGWRNDDRYDWNRARLRNRNAYRLPRYYAPPGAGYGYRRFGVGVQLSRSLFQQDYWLDDPYAYRLPPAYGPYRWVRYHGDALLVDLRTGRVIDVVYDIFY
jgi:Ni/Co efflux regulator RcnB